MRSEQVPTRIVMNGTSTMKLHERFSNLPQPTAPKRPVSVPNPQRTKQVAPRLSTTRSGAVVRKQLPRNNYVEEQVYMDDGMFEEDEYEEEVYPVQQRVSYGGVRRGMNTRVRGIQRPRLMLAPQMHVPIEARLTVPQTQYVYVPVQRGFRGRGGISRGRGIAKHFQQPRNNMKVQHYQGFKRGGFVNSRGGKWKQPFQKQPKMSAEQMDRDLDAYMKKGKHTPITI